MGRILVCHIPAAFQNFGIGYCFHRGGPFNIAVKRPNGFIVKDNGKFGIWSRLRDVLALLSFCRCMFIGNTLLSKPFLGVQMEVK